VEAERVKQAEAAAALPPSAAASAAAATATEAEEGTGAGAGEESDSLVPKVPISFELDHHGLVRLLRAEAVFEFSSVELVPTPTPATKPSA
ncbi:hypothetical protein LXA31_17920, partial [Erwinia amylovora]|uniref:hypothetical protein n=1 Tax=Erwinia amylovora TaxID=552 RepID=UPI0020C11A19